MGFCVFKSLNQEKQTAIPNMGGHAIKAVEIQHATRGPLRQTRIQRPRETETETDRQTEKGRESNRLSQERQSECVSIYIQVRSTHNGVISSL